MVRPRIEYWVFALLGFLMFCLSGCVYPNARTYNSGGGPLSVTDSSYTGPASATSNIDPNVNVPTPGSASISAGLDMPTQNVTAQPGSTVTGPAVTPVLRGTANANK